MIKIYWIYLLILLFTSACSKYDSNTRGKICSDPTHKNFKVVYSKMNNNYAVKINCGGYGWVFLWKHEAMDKEYDWLYTPVTTFPDSCSAKIAAFEYVDQLHRKNSYK